MQITQIVNSFYASNTYVLSEEHSAYCWLVDVGDIEPVLDILGNRKVNGLLLTHSHFDHIYGVNKLVDLFPECIIYTSVHGKEGLGSEKLNLSLYHDNSLVLHKGNVCILEDGEEVQLFPTSSFKAIYTPGHDWSCVSYYNNDVIFTGDSYIPNNKLVTVFPKSDKTEALLSLNKIINLLETRDAYPGHGQVVKCNNK